MVDLVGTGYDYAFTAFVVACIALIVIAMRAWISDKVGVVESLLGLALILLVPFAGPLLYLLVFRGRRGLAS